jgi:DhnA family fructose-bisphosphate aldolase class Ia
MIPRDRGIRESDHLEEDRADLPEAVEIVAEIGFDAVVETGLGVIEGIWESLD